MSPVAQMVQLRIHSETRPSVFATPPFSVSRASCTAGLECDRGGACASPLDTPPSSMLPRDVSCHSTSAMLPAHAAGEVSKSMLFTSLNHALGTVSPSSSMFAKPSRAPSGAGSLCMADYPTCLSVHEVARVQQALAHSAAALGIRLITLLEQRCREILGSSAATPADPLWQRRVAEVITRCQATAQAQVSMSHNMQRWTSVLSASDGGYADDEDGAAHAASEQHTCLQAAAADLRRVAEAQMQRMGVAASPSQLGKGQLVELLLGSGIKPLGKKSLGSVWMHHLGRELVAVKWITIEDDPGRAGYTAVQKQGMLIREVEAMMRLHHPNIVCLLGITTMATPTAVTGLGTGRVAEMPLAHTERAGSGAGGSTAKPLEQATVGIVLELCMYGTLQVCSRP